MLFEAAMADNYKARYVSVWCMCRWAALRQGQIYDLLQRFAVTPTMSGTSTAIANVLVLLHLSQGVKDTLPDSDLIRIFHYAVAIPFSNSQ